LDEYTNAVWIGPPRGYIEPVKEVTANIKRLQNNMTTLAEIRAEDGGEWASTVEQRAKEKRTIGSYPELTNQSENDNAKPV
jgi:capsid protein